jgi:NAD(P) transhydrogenase subunit alpha
MYVNVAVLTETRPHERRLALVPAVAPMLLKLGARLHMQPGAGAALHLEDSAWPDVAFIADRSELVRNADVVLCCRTRR